jgi:uncharacterized phage protein (TIGR01671 family)
MKKTKYKAWDVEKKEMIDDVFINGQSGHVICLFNSGYEGDYSLDKMIPIEYTGVKDKNGKEIYEGDILRAGNELTTPWKVYWREDKCGYWAEQTRGSFLKSPLWGMGVDRHFEVIGNIYTNPELNK